MKKKRLESLYKVSFILLMSIVAMAGLTFAAITFDTWATTGHLQGGDALTVDHVNEFYDVLGDLLAIITESDGDLAIGASGGNLAVGTATVSKNLKLDVEGNVGATGYCDQNGENCFSHSGLENSFFIPCLKDEDDFDSAAQKTIRLETETEIGTSCSNCCNNGRDCTGRCVNYRSRHLNLVCETGNVKEIAYDAWTDFTCTCPGTCVDPVDYGP